MTKHITVKFTEDQLKKLTDIVFQSTEDKTHSPESKAFEVRILRILYEKEEELLLAEAKTN